MAFEYRSSALRNRRKNTGEVREGEDLEGNEDQDAQQEQLVQQLTIENMQLKSWPQWHKWQQHQSCNTPTPRRLRRVYPTASKKT